MDRYDVYKDGKLIGSGLLRENVARLIHVGKETFDLHRYGKSESDYPLTLNGYEIHIKPTEKGTPTNLPPKLIKEWDDMVAAAEMIRQGQGKIVFKRINGTYRKVTVPR